MNSETLLGHVLSHDPFGRTVDILAGPCAVGVFSALGRRWEALGALQCTYLSCISPQISNRRWGLVTKSGWCSSLLHLLWLSKQESRRRMLVGTPDETLILICNSCAGIVFRADLEAMQAPNWKKGSTFYVRRGKPRDSYRRIARRVITAIRITNVRWWSYLHPQHRNWSS